MEVEFLFPPPSVLDITEEELEEDNTSILKETSKTLISCINSH